MRAMSAREYIECLNVQMSYLFAFARQINELDFAGSLTGEFRGAQDAGWATTITAHQVYDELVDFSQSPGGRTVAEFRVILMLYCQLSEAGGVYESLKNLMGIFTLQPYLLWPFKDLVRVKKEPRRIIGPNSNATFRDLATQANAIGLSGLAELLETAFRDDIRNGISHADYVIWGDGLRLRKRNGGFAEKLSFDQVNEALTKGIGFFEILRSNIDKSVKSFHPPRDIVGKFSGNFPMEWTVAYDPQRGAFGISGSSPAPVTSPEYLKQVEINVRLGGKALAMFLSGVDETSKALETHMAQRGFEPSIVELSIEGLGMLRNEVDKLALWDERFTNDTSEGALVLSPWGFRWIASPERFDEILPHPLVDVQVE